MRSQVGSLALVVSRLEYVADAFLKLARRHMENSCPSQPVETGGFDYPDAGPANELTQPIRHATIPVLSSNNEECSTAPNISIPSCMAIPDPARAFSEPFYGSVDGNTMIDSHDVPNIDDFMNWLPADPSPSQSADLLTSTEQTEVDLTGSNLNSPTARKGIFDSTFDWLSWDMYWNGLN
jgi:hypothetical protein